MVRYEEVAAGHIDHAIRVTFSQTQRAYILPATHFASSRTDSTLAPPTTAATGSSRARPARGGTTAT